MIWQLISTYPQFCKATELTNTSHIAKQDWSLPSFNKWCLLVKAVCPSQQSTFNNLYIHFSEIKRIEISSMMFYRQSQTCWRDHVSSFSHCKQGPPLEGHWDLTGLLYFREYIKQWMVPLESGPRKPGWYLGCLILFQNSLKHSEKLYGHVLSYSVISTWQGSQRDLKPAKQELWPLLWRAIRTSSFQESHWERQEWILSSWRGAGLLRWQLWLTLWLPPHDLEAEILNKTRPWHRPQKLWNTVCV